MVRAELIKNFMANPLKCDLCAKPATVHLTQIVSNKVHKVDLCETCAQAKGVTDPSGFSLADLLLKASQRTPAVGVSGLSEAFSKRSASEKPLGSVTPLACAQVSHKSTL